MNIFVIDWKLPDRFIFDYVPFLAALENIPKREFQTPEFLRNNGTFLNLGDKILVLKMSYTKSYPENEHRFSDHNESMD